MTKHEDILVPEHPLCPFVTKDVCLNRTKTARWVAGVFFGLFGVFLSLIVYASSQANEANIRFGELSNTVNQVGQLNHEEMLELRSSFNTHKATQSATERAILEKLNELKEEVLEQRKEQRVMLEKILEIQVEVVKNKQ